MDDKICISNEEYLNLSERLNKLAVEKSYLQLITHLMGKMSAVSGLENTLQNLLQIILDSIGGSNLIIYYIIDNEIFYADVLGKRLKVGHIEDDAVKKVFDTKEFIELQSDFIDTKLMAEEFTKAYTWVFPLQVGNEFIGVFKIENLYVTSRDLQFHLPTFFGYAAHILKNEILGQTRLKAAFDKLSEENNLRRQAEEELIIINNELENRVVERTNELHQANLQLEDELAERNWAEQELESQYRLFSALINSTSDIVIFSLDKSYCYTAFNESHREEMKKVWKVDIHVGMNLLDCMQIKELRELAKLSIDKAFSGVTFSEIQHQPDLDIYYELNWNPIFQNEEVIGITAFIRDITKRKHDEVQILKLNRIYSVLSNINQTIVRIHDRDTMLNEACRIAIEYGKFRMAWIGMVNFQTNKVEVVAAHGASGDYLEKINIDLNDELQSIGPAGIVVRTGKLKVSNVIANDESMILWSNDAVKYGYKSVAAFPLVVFNVVIGAITIYSSETNFFDEDNIKLLDEMAMDISFALEFAEIETERRKNDELLKQSEARLNEAQRIAHIGSWELDLTKDNLIWSDEIYRIFEINKEEFGASYDAFLNTIHPDDRDVVNTAYSLSVKNRTQYSVDHRLLFKEGRIKYVHEQCETFYDSDGNPLSSIGTVQDITKRKKAEEKAIQLAAIVESTNDAVIGKTLDGVITSWNKGAEAIYGYTENEMIGKSISNIVPTKYLDEIPTILEKIKKGEHIKHLETMRQKKDGQCIYVSLTISPVFDANRKIIGVSAIERDITEHVKTEKALQKSEEKYRTLIQKIQAAVVVHDSDTQIISCNVKAQELLGLTEDQLMGKTGIDPAWHFFREDWTIMPYEEYPVNKVLSTRQELRNLIVGVHRPNNENDVWVLVNADPVFGEKDEIFEVVVTFIDITERKEIEGALRKASVEIKDLYNNAPCGYHSLNNNGLIVRMNETELNWLGYSSEEVIGKMKFTDFLAPASLKTFEENFPRFKITGLVRNLEFDLVRKDGTILSILLNSSAIKDKDGNFQMSRSTVNDITERKLMEGALRKSEERFRRLAENARDIIYRMSLPDGRYEYISPAVYSLLGHNPEEYYANPLLFKQAIHPEWHNYFEKQWINLLKSEIPPTYEYQIIHKSGEIRWLNQRNILVKDEDGNPIAIEGIVTDITKSKRLEEELRESEYKLGEAARIAHVGYWDRDLVAQTIMLSEEARKIFGLPSDYRAPSLNEWHAQWLKLIHPEDQQRAAEAAANALSDGPPYNIEYRVVLSEGTIRYIHSYAEVTKDKMNKPIRMFGTMLDITERKQAEEALRDTARYLNEAQRLAHIGSWELDLINNQLIWSDEIYRIVEIDSEEFGATYEAFLDVIHPDDREVVNLAYINSLKTKIPFSIDHRLLLSDGHIKYVHNQCETYYDDDRPVRSIGTIQDISERKHIEEALRESEWRYREIFDNVLDGIYLLDVMEDDRFRTIEVNKALERITGIPRSFSVGKTQEETVPAEVAAIVNKKYRHCVEAGIPVEEEAELDLPAGKRYFHSTLIPARDENGRIYRIVGISRDITDRKLAEEKIKESEQRLRLTVEAAQIGIWDWDIKNDRWFASPIYYTMLGYEPKFGFADRAEWLDRLHPDDAEKVSAKIQNVLSGNFKEYRYEARMRHANGSYRWQNVIGFGIERDDDGKVTRMIGIRMDIDERKRAEEKIQKLNQDLEKMVADRTAQLENANKELETFSYSVSHDLRSPLRSIDGFSQVLLEDYYDKLDDQGKNYLHKVRSASQHMAQLIDDILNLSRVNRFEIILQQVNLSDMVKKLADELVDMEPERKIDFIVQKDVIVKGDERLLYIVIDNLVRNAWKFTSKHLTAKVEFGKQQQNDQTIYFIRDDGAGFEMQYAQKLFGAFQRLHSASEFPGTGIGLATVQRIIHKHGGNIWAEGEVEKGAAFYFTIP